jgi:hypothetical protein
MIFFFIHYSVRITGFTRGNQVTPGSGAGYWISIIRDPGADFRLLAKNRELAPGLHPYVEWEREEFYDYPLFNLDKLVRGKQLLYPPHIRGGAPCWVSEGGILQLPPIQLR